MNYHPSEDSHSDGQECVGPGPVSDNRQTSPTTNHCLIEVEDGIPQNACHISWAKVVGSSTE